jgi:hypothetical protein
MTISSFQVALARKANFPVLKNDPLEEDRTCSRELANLPLIGLYLLAAVASLHQLLHVWAMYIRLLADHLKWFEELVDFHMLTPL